MANLRVNYAGLQLENPFLIGSGSIATDLNQITEERARRVTKRIVQNKWAGIVLKTVVQYSAPERAGPFMWSPHEKLLPDILQNLGPWETKIRPDNLRRNIQIAKDAGLVVIGNVLGTSHDEWVSLSKQVEDCGANALELNVSCPHSGHELPLIGQDPAFTEDIVSAVKEECSIPVIPKLPAIIVDVVSVAKAAERAGADAIAAINTIPGLVGIDVETGIPIHRDIRNNARLSGVSGPMLKPLGLSYVAQMASTMKVPICGIGGIGEWIDVAEYIMAGARAVQICTAVLMKGFGIAPRLVRGLDEFMERKGFSSTKDFEGISLKYLRVDMKDMDLTSEVVADIDPNLCTGCGLCVTACADSITEALSLKDRKVTVDPTLCIGCGLCGTVCRVGAVSYKVIGTRKSKTDVPTSS